MTILDDELDNVIPRIGVCELSLNIDDSHDGWSEHHSEVLGSHLLWLAMNRNQEHRTYLVNSALFGDLVEMEDQILQAITMNSWKSIKCIAKGITTLVIVRDD
jgi:hypothetical protein